LKPKVILMTRPVQNVQRTSMNATIKQSCQRILPPSLIKTAQNCSKLLKTAQNCSRVRTRPSPGPSHHENIPSTKRSSCCRFLELTEFLVSETLFEKKNNKKSHRCRKSSKKKCHWTTTAARRTASSCSDALHESHEEAVLHIEQPKKIFSESSPGKETSLTTPDTTLARPPLARFVPL